MRNRGEIALTVILLCTGLDQLYSQPAEKNDSNNFVQTAPQNKQKIGEFIDPRDGTVYPWLEIGQQVWMARNLAYLPSVNSLAYGSYDTPYYYVYLYQGNNVSEAKGNIFYLWYGALYNWPAAMEVCPSGWHLPSDEEWKQMEVFLGMSQKEADDDYSRGTNEGGMLKESYSMYWKDPNKGATDTYGFRALPGGYCCANEKTKYFSRIGEEGSWWTSTTNSTYWFEAWDRYLYYDKSTIWRNSERPKDLGMSVRCIKD
jgi:uncharacterized protein (TIGR02145 family)